MSDRQHAEAAARYLDAWARDDYEGFTEDRALVSHFAEELIADLREKEGDARALMVTIEVELEERVNEMLGALYLVRRAVDLLLDPPATRFLSRGEVVQALLAE